MRTAELRVETAVLVSWRRRESFQEAGYVGMCPTSWTLEQMKKSRVKQAHKALKKSE